MAKQELTVPTITWEATLSDKTGDAQWGTTLRGTSDTGYTIMIAFDPALGSWLVTRFGAIPPSAHRFLASAPSLATAKQWVEDWLAEPRRKNGR